MVIQLYFQDNAQLMFYMAKKVINLSHIVLEEVKIDSSKLLILSFMELTSNYLMLNKLKEMQLMLNKKYKILKRLFRKLMLNKRDKMFKRLNRIKIMLNQLVQSFERFKNRFCIFLFLCDVNKRGDKCLVHYVAHWN